MKYTILSAVLALLVTACGKPELREWEPYAQEFQQEASLRGRTVDIDGLDISIGDAGRAAAVCERSFLTSPRIVINKTAWALASEPERTWILFHEMGHCLLGRAHRTDLEDAADGIRPVSIMFPDTGSPYVLQFEKHHAEYLDELFM